MSKSRTCIVAFSILMVLTAGSCLFPAAASAHCDALDGPVVNAARKALQEEDPTPVLIWVQKGDEPEIQKAFQLTLAVRKLGPEAQALAETYFFETVVRIHRAGEGAPYTGLKPEGTDPGPAILAADRSLAEGRLEPTERLLTDSVRSGLRKRFDLAAGAKNYRKNDVEAGRRYVAAYVSFIHYVDELYGLAVLPWEEHAPGTEAPHPHASR
jgi:uncharacterized protein DUF6448